MRKIPKKNYIVLIIVVVVTLFLTFFIRQKYLEQKKYDSMTNERINFISEIKEKELENYLRENREVVIYIASSSDENIKNFELELKEYVLKEQLGKEIIYINLNNVSKTFIENLKNNFFAENLKNSKLELKENPNMMIVEDGKIISLMYSKNQQINIEDVKEYLKKYIEEVL